MKAVERKLNKAQKATVWLLIISLLLATCYVVFVVVINNLGNGNTPTTEKPDLIDGEATYLNQTVAYPNIKEEQMTFIEISNKDGKFGVSRSGGTGSFLFHYYEDGKEQSIPYIPPIIAAEDVYNYESLYAIENNDSFGRIYYLTYLCSALGAPYFNERIELPSEDTEQGKAKRTALLREYGITKSEVTTISFDYYKTNEKGELLTDKVEGVDILLGGKPLSGTGYYFMIASRPDYVYYTRSEYFSYALMGFEKFIKGMLVSEGLSGESVYGPYLTTDFKTWLGHTYKEESDKVFTNDMPGYEKYDNPTVTVTTDYKSVIDKGLGFEPKEGELITGYDKQTGIDYTFDLEALKEHPDYARIKNTLVGKSVGSYENSNILLTLLTEIYNSDTKNLNFADATELEYRYSISEIESVITDSAEITSGTVDASAGLVKVTYRYTVGGQTVKHDCHAVIDLNDLSAENKAKLVGQAIGEVFLAPIDITVNYTKDNAKKSTEKLVITNVIAIFDESGAYASEITEDTLFQISYYYIVDGKKYDSNTRWMRLSEIKDDSKFVSLKTELLGKGKGKYDMTVFDATYYYEYMREFTAYEISEIQYFVANEIIVSFAFANASERDPFYGETFFKNTLTNEYRLYGLNSGVCESAVKLLGGVGTDSNSAVGYMGETVAIGLTPDNMDNYGLYAHKIYFEMPRDIYDKTEADGGASGSADNDQLSDYAWGRTLGFTLYVSDRQYDKQTGTYFRYAGSDMYGIVAKVSAEDFDFLEYGFVEFWARKSMVMVNIEKLTDLKLEFNMQDLKGSYDFDISFEDRYTGYLNGEYVMSGTQFEGSSRVSYQTVLVTASGDAFKSEFKDRFGTEKTDLATLYNYTMGDGKTTYYPGSNTTTLGAAYFNSAYETLQLTGYLDNLPDEDKDYTAPPIMRMHLKVSGSTFAPNFYTYDFYRIDERRIMVSFYISDADGNKIESYGEVCDFYITTFAFKKLVNNYICLLNGQVVDESVGYPD